MTLRAHAVSGRWANGERTECGRYKYKYKDKYKNKYKYTDKYRKTQCRAEPLSPSADGEILYL